MPFAEGMLRDFWGLKHELPHAAMQSCQHAHSLCAYMNLNCFEAKRKADLIFSANSNHITATKIDSYVICFAFLANATFTVTSMYFWVTFFSKVARFHHS